MASAGVDFIVIGAQKSGTTALYRYLVAHPEIYMPAAKEVEFFNDDGRYARGIEWYLREYFAAAPEGAVKGEASTHYMMYPAVPERIRSAFPEARLVAVLRNPIDRAYSHYRMSSTMRGRDARDFRRAVEEAAAVDPASPPDPDHDYLRFGEYGRILGRYLDRFERGQLAVFFAEELAEAPARVMAELYAFLGVDAAFCPPNLGRRYNVSGERWLPGLDAWARRQAGRVKRSRLLGRFVSRDRFEAFKFWTFTELAVRRREDPGPDADTRRFLARYFERDVRALRAIVDRDPPWPDFAAASARRAAPPAVAAG